MSKWKSGIKTTAGILAAATAGIGLATAPFCWILKDGLIGAYPSYGIGAVSHFFQCFRWGIWPISTMALLLIVVCTRLQRLTCFVILSVCICIYMLPHLYTKVIIPDWETPFSPHSRITLQENGQMKTFLWPETWDTKEGERIWNEWNYAHNSTHCRRKITRAVIQPIARCEMEHFTLIWDARQVEIINEQGTFNRERNQEDDRLLNYLFRELF